MRKRIYEIIEVAKSNDKMSSLYDAFMLITIILSVIPLAFKQSNYLFDIIDKTTVIVFIIDYVLRLITSDYKIKQDAISFVKYPFTPMAIIDLLSILPSLTVLNKGFKLLKIFRLFRTLRIFKVFKAARYSKNIQLLCRVVKKQKDLLSAVCGIAILYILICALIILNVEPDSFDSYFDAVYWATVSLTTVGYGDIYPISTFGRLITMVSSFVGIAIVALPTGIITTGIMEELNGD